MSDTTVRSTPRRRRGRPVLGAILGLLFGLFLAVDLLAFGVIPLHSVVVLILPVAGLILGIVIGLTAAFGGGRAGAATGMLVAAPFLIGAGPVLAAEAPPSLQGDCEGWADIEGYERLDPATSSGVYTVPIDGEAEYHGLVKGVSGDRENIDGEIHLALPPPLADVSLGSWGPTGEETGKDDIYRWSGSGEGGDGVADLPLQFVPRGMTFRVEGSHTEPGVSCSGYVDLSLEGGFADSPVGPASLGMTVLSGAGLFWAGRTRKP